MPRTDNPKSADLILFLRSTGLSSLIGMDDETLAGTYDTPSIMLASIAEWERLTKWYPFKANSANETRFFDAPERAWTVSRIYGGSHLFLPCGVVSLTSLHVNLTPTDTTGIALVQGTDYWLEPASAAYTKRPYTSIHFKIRRWTSPYTERQSIKAIGKFGYSLTVPDDAWLAMIQYGAGLLMQQIGIGALGLLTSWTEAGVSEVYSPKALEGAQTAWQTNFDRTVQRYRRISL